MAEELGSLDFSKVSELFYILTFLNVDGHTNAGLCVFNRLIG
jgi:hypothetical protein